MSCFLACNPPHDPPNKKKHNHIHTPHPAIAHACTLSLTSTPTQVKTIREQIVDIESLIADVEIKHSDLLVAYSAEGTKSANTALDKVMERISMVANKVRTSLKRMAEQNKAEEVCCNALLSLRIRGVGG